MTSVFEDAARARASEANYLAGGGYLCGAVYLAGYVVECKLKILLSKLGKPFPTSGARGHDLRGLWDTAGLRHEDMKGFRRAFLDHWSTNMRYTSIIESEHSPHDLLRGAQELAGYVSMRIIYAQNRRDGRKRS